MKNLLHLFIFLFGGLCAHAQVANYVPPVGLVAWFPFRLTAFDSSLHGHNGVMYGCTNAKSRFGENAAALRFNGVSDYIYIPSGTATHGFSMNIISSFTISAWVKAPTYATAQDMQIYWRGNSLTACDPHMLYIKGGQVYVRRDVDPGNVTNEVGTPITSLDTNYHMFTGTYDAASGLLKIYVDAVLMNTSTSTGLQTYPTTGMYNYMGAVDGGSWQFFRGTMDELGVWNRALSGCEIARLYLALPNTITSQPVNYTGAVGGSASFSVSTPLPFPTYQWQVRTGSVFSDLSNVPPYSGVNTGTLTISPLSASMNGSVFRCIIASGASCNGLATDTARLVVPSSVSVDNMAFSKSSAIIYPNPGNGKFKLFNGVAVSKVYVTVLDLDGRILFANIEGRAEDNNSIDFDLSDRLSPGVYLIKLVIDGKTRYVRYKCD